MEATYQSDISDILQYDGQRMFCLKVVLGKFDILKKRNEC